MLGVGNYAGFPSTGHYSSTQRVTFGGGISKTRKIITQPGTPCQFSLQVLIISSVDGQQRLRMFIARTLALIAIAWLYFNPMAPSRQDESATTGTGRYYACGDSLCLRGETVAWDQRGLSRFWGISFTTGTEIPIETKQVANVCGSQMGRSPYL